MSNLTLNKISPAGNALKSTSRGTTPRQQDFHEVNKRRTFLQDSSWIKKLPEEEKEENYGRVVLTRHNSHDALDRKTNERDEPKVTISRYRSDDTLDRISDRSDAAKIYKANTLDNRLTNRSISTFRSSEAKKPQPGSLFSMSTTNATASTTAATPVKKKRQSWFPPPPPGYNATPSTGVSRREPTVHPPIPPKPRSPVSSNQLRRDNSRQIYAPKSGVYAETNRPSERNARSLDGDNIVKVATSPQKTDKGEELENLIKMNKSLSRNQGLDGLFRGNLKAEQTEKRAKSLENLICVNARTDRDGKGNQGFGSLIKDNQRTHKNEEGPEGLDNVIRVNSKESENITRGRSLDNLIKVTPAVNRSNRGSKDLDEFIKVNPRTEKSVQDGQSLDSLIKVAPETNRNNQGNQDLDNLIKVIPSANKSNQDLDKLIKVNSETLKNNQRSQDLNNLIKVNLAGVRSHQSQDLDNFIEVKPSALRNTKRDQNLENLVEVNSSVSSKKNGSSYPGTRHTEPKDTAVYTRTYMENSKSPKDGYQETTSGKVIQTVYSTSDRSVIERDMCTYCRKPLGTETKMILDELQICCHSTCFKCEICKQPLENLQAGDSIWIYRQTIHCEPCYSKVLAKWIQ
ncbi:sciellin isoform X10 [Dasypus novemcinctus]|uniref:sciellin isoform X10 n=1 Tax=Dasypus novemcinctus TaxID=9361 RepID=UPI00265F1977|nr:sciellin isoform X10 [Dasypus novemcinctus]